MPFCKDCGTSISSGASFCPQCGQPVRNALAKVTSPQQNALVSFLAVVISCCLFSLVCWFPFVLLGNFFLAIVPRGDCSNVNTGSVTMYLCSGTVAFRVILVPLVLMALLIAFRRRLVPVLRALVSKVPPPWRFLGPPCIATGLFALTWAAAHSSTYGGVGFVPQTIFPAVAGIACYLGAIGTRWLQRNLDPLLQFRDRLHRKFRVAGAAGLSVVYALMKFGLTVREDPIQVQQKVVLVGLLVSYALLVPRRHVPPA
jgi:hypothetical protein